MQWKGIYLNAAAVSLGRKEETAVAVAEGRYAAEENEVDGYLAIRVEDKRASAVEMAIDAAKLAVQRAGSAADEVDLVVHASCGHPGIDHFASASYIQHHTLGGTANALEVRQFSNGGLAAIEVAAALLTARTAPSAALITTADRFAHPGYDRYRSDKGILLSDGATGLVLSRSPGVAELLSTGLLGDTTWGDAYIGDEPWTDAAQISGRPVDLRTRREQFLAAHGDVLVEVVQSVTQRQQEAVEIALADAGLTSADVARWVFPNHGLTVVDWTFRKGIGIEEAQTTWEWGRQIGHIGAGDQTAGLTHLLETRAVRPGDIVALCGVGMGFSYGCVLVRILEQPEWSVSTE
ncbi:ketoacyl-ACP synthase III family protein [Nocardia iowensis]|uniref:Ketoacyl-ACP synthase III family protein n=1 Tax=Nocardia iowensis TaxID=204891 RepID=A0ABX8RXI5_NOCIO|nr:ketoacyl-ACP synthase III family protein [Nocardia iowensis]QXN93080.1 ketoacyl-ACP synthase III family protein [Nocardia iowensis]